MSQNELPPGVEIERVFLVEGRYTADATEKRPAVRGAHLARVAELKRSGTIVEVGAYSDEPMASILLVRAATAEEALAIAHEDVYVSAGVWGEVTARPFGRVSLER